SYSFKHSGNEYDISSSFETRTRESFPPLTLPRLKVRSHGFGEIKLYREKTVRTDATEIVRKLTIFHRNPPHILTAIINQPTGFLISRKRLQVIPTFIACRTTIESNSIRRAIFMSMIVLQRYFMV